ncbi:hypothetical protein DFQ10_1114 [Winogradskyella eximia]|uniref:Cytochrome c domain-containing protein n=1 Tax=Winogradskyella eximia TaxID=262006 RepID=A0A3D9GPP1_9FLAO|nr:hypothetical protein [Winogradskyella eximia]RED38183.1 hypothetical protein DFQ10_1114 [Winogradskyella eximia]
MKTNLYIVILLIGLISCNTNQKNKVASELESSTKDVAQKVEFNEKGYKLMTQKCYLCHFETPDPSKKDQMIAPPMLRVQEHYKPTYPNKTEFVNAIVAIVKNPSLEKTLMPGAVKKFNLMPKLIYDEAELRLIAETIYDYDFGSAPKMNREMSAGTLALNNGEKWILKKESIAQINAIVTKLNSYEASDVEAYNQLGKDIFNDAKTIMLENAYTGELFDQIHNFFFSIENNMHTLMSTTTENEAKQQLEALKTKFKEFHNYFE